VPLWDRRQGSEKGALAARRGAHRPQAANGDLARFCGLGCETGIRTEPITAEAILLQKRAPPARSNDLPSARCRTAVAGRPYDANGLSVWVSQLPNQGQAAVAQQFVDSSEYQSVHGAQDNTAFVNSLYESVLGRAAEPGGLAAWTQMLTDGTSRGEVAAAIADSAEAKQRWADITSAGIFARDFDAATVREDYLAAFGREADTGGLAHWTNLLKTEISPADLAQDLAGSSEFQALHGQQTDMEYVESLYENGLGRPGDPGGEAFWVNSLQSGASRGDVLKAIAQSQEGQQHLGWALS
jgi:uncharacterized protein DUF4214